MLRACFGNFEPFSCPATVNNTKRQRHGIKFTPFLCISKYTNVWIMQLRNISAWHPKVQDLKLKKFAELSLARLFLRIATNGWLKKNAFSRKSNTKSLISLFLFSFRSRNKHRHRRPFSLMASWRLLNFSSFYLLSVFLRSGGHSRECFDTCNEFLIDVIFHPRNPGLECDERWRKKKQCFVVKKRLKNNWMVVICIKFTRRFFMSGQQQRWVLIVLMALVNFPIEALLGYSVDVLKFIKHFSPRFLSSPSTVHGSWWICERDKMVLIPE